MFQAGKPLSTANSPPKIVESPAASSTVPTAVSSSVASAGGGNKDVDVKSVDVVLGPQPNNTETDTMKVTLKVFICSHLVFR